MLTGILCSNLYSWHVHYNVTYEQFSRAFVVEGIGTALGALLYWATSAISNCCHGDAMMGVALVMLAAYPCYHSFIYLMTSSLVFGVAKGLLFVGMILSLFN